MKEFFFFQAEVRGFEELHRGPKQTEPCEILFSAFEPNKKISLATDWIYKPLVY